MYKQRDSLLLQKGTIRNAEGYTQYTYTGASDSTKAVQYYFHWDHLGNVCAVWNATTDEVVQRTAYYSSGVPMAQSMGQSVQPIKYNAHEYIEAHGYDVYDYGFRGYYATIGRFTSIDPLCERTPWQSPYAYANNNWANQTDWMGLMGLMIDDLCSPWKSHSWRYTEIDNDGKVIKHIDDDNDKRVMYVNALGEKEEVGSEIEDEDYIKGHRVYFRHRSGGVKMFYNYAKAISVYRDTPFDVRVGRWLRAQGVDKWEEELLEKERPFIQGFVLMIPILAQCNDIKTLTTGENIYGTKADDLDYILSFIDLYTLGAGKFLISKETIEGLGVFGLTNSLISTVKTIRDEQKESGESR